jgi:phage protein D
MSDKNAARRADVEVFFAGVDISKSIRPYLLSLSYTDNEADETDDLQITLEDRESVWINEWLNVAIQSAASESKSTESAATYKVVETTGVKVRNGAGEDYKKLGELAYGSTVKVSTVLGVWTEINYSGQTAYVKSSAIEATNTSDKWSVGDVVIATGNPQYTSYGEGVQGAKVTNYEGSISRLNLKTGVPYPICVGTLGWFAEDQVTQKTVSVSEQGQNVTIKGLKIQAAIVQKNWNGDGKDSVLSCGQFELDEIEASGPPSIISIKATSLPYNSQVRQTKKNKAWESYTLSGIAKEIAQKGGMACMYESDTDPTYKRVEQISMSDIQFLTILCKNAGISLKVTNNIIVLFDQMAYESKTASITIAKGDGKYISYKLSSGDADTRYSSCRVSYVNPASGKTISATAYAEDYEESDENNQTLEINAKVSTIAEALTIAKKRLRLHNKFSKTADFTMVGDANITAGITVTLKDFGLWDGKYIVSQAKHDVGSGGYKTKIKLRRVLEGY